MPIYRVRPGFRHGLGKKLGPGDLVEHTEAEAAGFTDKLELVSQDVPQPTGDTENHSLIVNPAKFDVDDSTVEQVITAVREGAITAEAALEAEQAGKQRVSLLSWLAAEIERLE